MHRKMWVYLVVGWLLSILVSPNAVLGMFKAKKAG